ncbi:hypothetical protein O6H91_Y240900 [Diphasiastrum complanatum]|nr:hypothetical protein O6H91_Y240900 [Diphasiastrum complanatum]KAJ7299387.1 hypothetical protein O6H91_Y240900 [Diphasiastrum complanatum]
MVGEMDAKGKSLWADVVRRADGSNSVQSIEGGIKEKATLYESETNTEIGNSSSENGVESSSVPAISAIPLLAKPLEGVEVPLDGNGDREAGSVILEAHLNTDSATEASPKPVKSAWKNLIKPSTDSREGAVMGAESWPSLADSRTRKNPASARSSVAQRSSDGDPEKEVASATESSGQEKIVSNSRPGDVHLGHRKTEASKDVSDAASSAPSVPVPSTTVSDVGVQGPLQQHLEESMPAARASSPAPGNNVGRGRMPNQRGNFSNWASHPRNRNSGFSGRGGMPYQPQNNNGILPGPGGMYNQRGANGLNPRPFRAPRQRGNYGSSHGNRRPFHEQGRGPNNWQPQQIFANGPSYAPPFQQPPFDPRSSTWGVPNVFSSFGFFNNPVHEGFYYQPMGLPGFHHYDLSGALHVLPHFAQNSTVEHLLVQQIEYYFSDENLLKDEFLRSKMDAEGFVPASLIASFNKIRMLNADANMILNALQNSRIVEVQGESLRKRNNGPAWPLPTNQPSTSSSADDNHSADSSNNEPPQTNGESVVDDTPEISPESNIGLEHSAQQSATLILDRAESSKASRPAGDVEPEPSEPAEETNLPSLHPNPDAVRTHKDQEDTTQ